MKEKRKKNVKKKWSKNERRRRKQKKKKKKKKIKKKILASRQPCSGGKTDWAGSHFASLSPASPAGDALNTHMVY